MSTAAQDKAVVKKRVEALTLASDLDTLVAQGSQAYMAAAMGGMAETMSLAVAVVEIEKALSPAIMKPFMSLQGKAIGFKTDKDRNGGYPEQIVRQAMIEGMLVGVPMAGNCMNIIAERCYVTKEGFTFRINEIQKQGMVKNFKFIIEPPVITIKKGGLANGKDAYTARVETSATWIQNGEEQAYCATIPVKGDAYASDDSYIGKAERKLKKRCYEQMTGLSLSDGDVGGMAVAPGVVVGDPGGYKPAPESESEASQVKSAEEEMQGLNRDLFNLRRKDAVGFVSVCEKHGLDVNKLGEADKDALERLRDELIADQAD